MIFYLLGVPLYLLCRDHIVNKDIQVISGYPWYKKPKFDASHHDTIVLAIHQRTSYPLLSDMLGK